MDVPNIFFPNFLPQSGDLFRQKLSLTLKFCIQRGLRCNHFASNIQSHQSTRLFQSQFHLAIVSPSGIARCRFGSGKISRDPHRFVCGTDYFLDSPNWRSLIELTAESEKKTS